MCQCLAPVFSAPWWVIKHIWRIPAPPRRPRQTDSHGMCAFFSRPHLLYAPFRKWICHLSDTRELLCWRLPLLELNESGGTCQKKHNLNTMWVILFCTIASVFGTARQAPKHQGFSFFLFSSLTKCYHSDLSFTPQMIETVNHVSGVRLTPISLSHPSLSLKALQ